MIRMMELKRMFAAGKAVRIRISRTAVLAGCLLLAAITSGGCGQKEQEDIPEMPEIEENSLAEWEASLEEGTIGELCAESIRGVSVMREGGAPFCSIL